MENVNGQQDRHASQGAPRGVKFFLTRAYLQRGTLIARLIFIRIEHVVNLL